VGIWNIEMLPVSIEHDEQEEKSNKCSRGLARSCCLKDALLMVARDDGNSADTKAGFRHVGPRLASRQETAAGFASSIDAYAVCT